MVDAGSLDRRVTIERATVSMDAYGAPVASWASVAVVWANYYPLSDREVWAAAQVSSEATARFTIRYSSAVASLSPADRLVMRGQRFGITGVKELGRLEWLEITAAATDDAPYIEPTSSEILWNGEPLLWNGEQIVFSA